MIAQGCVVPRQCSLARNTGRGLGAEQAGQANRGVFGLGLVEVRRERRLDGGASLGGRQMTGSVSTAPMTRLLEALPGLA